MFITSVKNNFIAVTLRLLRYELFHFQNLLKGIFFVPASWFLHCISRHQKDNGSFYRQVPALPDALIFQ